jgi:hypothetical protein
MTDDELVAKLKASATPPKEADDPRFWQGFAADLDRALAVKPRRRWSALAALGVAAAAALLLVTLHRRPAVHTAIIQDELVGSEDPTELVGELDDQELRAVATKF